MAGHSARESAYAELVAGLIDAREDVATERFDAELAAAEAAGRIDAATARTLRWWQRASVRAVTDHARTALPPVLAALDHAHEVAVDELAESERALDEALAAAFPARRAGSVASPQPAAARNADHAAQAESADHAAAETRESPTEPVDLTTRDPIARRMLVAGLTPLPPS